MTEFDLTFPHRYELKEFPELPEAGFRRVPVHYFPGTKTRPEHDGIWIRVEPAGAASWVGVFGFGYSSPPAMSRVLSMPDPDRFCVVSAGAAYLVKADEPKSWEHLALFPVLDVRLIPALELFVLSTFHKLAAVGPAGLAWESPRVCWDDLRIVRADAERIEGTAYNPTNTPPEMLFSVETSTGRSLLPVPHSIDGKPIW